MANYITDYHTGKGTVGKAALPYRVNKRLVGNLSACASYLVFKNYYNVNQVRLYAFTACRKHLLCPFARCVGVRSICRLTTSVCK